MWRAKSQAGISWLGFEGNNLVLCTVPEDPALCSLVGELKGLVIASNNGRQKRVLFFLLF